MSFNRLSSNRWYANIDDYPGDFEDLEMIWGADELLNRLSCGEDFVKVSIVADEIPTFPPNMKSVRIIHKIFMTIYLLYIYVM